MSALSPFLPHSVFEPECPQCGVALRPADGSIWSCPTCAFTAERVGGILLELRGGRAEPGTG